MRVVSYTLSLTGITPVGIGDGGMQGDHNATKVEFTLNEILKSAIQHIAAGRLIKYRLEITDGAGGFTALVLDEEGIQNKVEYSIPREVTLVGGICNIHLVISSIYMEENTIISETILFNFPAKLRFQETASLKSTAYYEYTKDITSALVLSKEYMEEAADAKADAVTAKASAITAMTNASTSATAAATSATNASNSAATASNRAIVVGAALDDINFKWNQVIGYRNRAEWARDDAKAYAVGGVLTDKTSVVGAKQYAEQSQASYHYTAEKATYVQQVVDNAVGVLSGELGEQYSDTIEETVSNVGVVAVVDCNRVGTDIKSGLINGIPLVEYQGIQEGTPFWNAYRAGQAHVYLSPKDQLFNSLFSGSGVMGMRPLDEEPPESWIYTFTGGRYISGVNAATVQLEYGKQYTLQFTANCDSPYPMSFDAGVFSAAVFASSNNTTSQGTVEVKNSQNATVYSKTHALSYSNFSYNGTSDSTTYYPTWAVSGTDYIVNLSFTSSYTGEAYVLLRNVNCNKIHIKNLLFCETAGLSMLKDFTITKPMLRMGNVYDTLDLKTKKHIQRIGMLSFTNNTLTTIQLPTDVLPNTTVYILAPEDDVTLPGRADVLQKTVLVQDVLTLSEAFPAFRVIYYKRTPTVTDVSMPDLPGVTVDTFRAFAVDEGYLPAGGIGMNLDLSITTYKSANLYVKKLADALVQLGGTL